MSTPSTYSSALIEVQRRAMVWRSYLVVAVFVTDLLKPTVHLKLQVAAEQAANTVGLQDVWPVGAVEKWTHRAAAACCCC
jgi:hypothetical protein